MEADRPKEIAWFEGLIFASLAVGVVQVLIALKGNVPPSIETLLFGFGLPILLTLLVSRRRSKAAMWVSIGLFVLGIPLMLLIIASGRFRGSVPIAAVQTILQLVAYAFLFMPDAWDWLNRRVPLPSLKDTFS
jgi:hypothetical protein